MAAASRFIDSTATVSDNRNSLQSWRSLTTSATLKARRRFVALRLSRLSARLGRPMLQGRPALSLECVGSSHFGFNFNRQVCAECDHEGHNCFILLLRD